MSASKVTALSHPTLMSTADDTQRGGPGDRGHDSPGAKGEPQRKRAWQWPLMVVALLSVPIVANGVLLVKATSDPSFVVEEDYYQKAIAWDERVEAERRSAALGWSAALRVRPAEVAGEPAEVRVFLEAHGGEVVRGAAVRVQARHNARAAHVLEATLVATPDGSYVGSLPIRRSGLWELELLAERGDDRFMHTERVDVIVPPGAPADGRRER